MIETIYKSVVTRELNGTFSSSVESKNIMALPDGDLLVRVAYSSLNYKDFLSSSGNKGVTRQYPHTPGIDAVGEVVWEGSSSRKFSIGDKVIVTSYDLGMNTAGGFGQYIRVPSTWALPLPENLSPKEAMVFGTAGFTAGLSVLKLIEKVAVDAGPIAVSGATGGVGSIAIAILAKLGYQVVAISGKNKQDDYLTKLGASGIIPRSDFATSNPKPILKGHFAGAIDTVGGEILTNIIKLTNNDGVVTCCGNAAGANLDITVYPFILRGLSLLGVDSQNCSMADRLTVWNKLATDWKPSVLGELYQEISLYELNEQMDLMSRGLLKGRVVVRLG